jgi:prepilin-type N-terminal cleavage/methylation domain-containing protein
MNTNDQLSRESGMSLAELLVTIAVLGIIGAVMSTVVLAGVRNHRSTEGEAPAIAGAIGIGFWLSADVTSADPAQVVVNASTSPCGAPGSSLVRMQWTDAGVTYYSAYQLSGGKLSRLFCTSASPTAAGSELGSGISAPVAPTWTGGALTIALNATNSGREVYRATLRPRSSGAGGPVGGCTGSLVLLRLSTSLRSGGRLQHDIELEFTSTGGTCSGLTYIVPDNAAVPNPVSGSLSGSSPTFTGTIDRNTNGWSARTFAINVQMAGATVASAVLTVTP